MIVDIPKVPMELPEVHEKLAQVYEWKNKILESEMDLAIACENGDRKAFDVAKSNLEFLHDTLWRLSRK